MVVVVWFRFSEHLFRFSILCVFYLRRQLFGVVWFCCVRLVSPVPDQDIGCEELLWNGLFCVQWDIKIIWQAGFPIVCKYIIIDAWYILILKVLELQKTIEAVLSHSRWCYTVHCVKAKSQCKSLCNRFLSCLLYRSSSLLVAYLL